jgi:hypothetical protein
VRYMVNVMRLRNVRNVEVGHLALNTERGPTARKWQNRETLRSRADLNGSPAKPSGNRRERLNAANVKLCGSRATAPRGKPLPHRSLWRFPVRSFGTVRIPSFHSASHEGDRLCGRYKRSPRRTFAGRQTLRDCRPKPLAENYFRRLKGSSIRDRYHGCRMPSTRSVTATH